MKAADLGILNCSPALVSPFRINRLKDSAMRDHMILGPRSKSTLSRDSAMRMNMSDGRGRPFVHFESDIAASQMQDYPASYLPFFE